MKHFVTYCAMDTRTGANPFWHSSLLMSMSTEEEVERMEVVDTWSFYGVPSSAAPNTWTSYFATLVGLPVDPKGNHGMICHEEIRHLDKGLGLHGVTFELTEEQFNFFQSTLTKKYNDQWTALNEIATYLGIKGKPPEQVKRHPFEDSALLIYDIEKKLAEAAGREPRLFPFDFSLTWRLLGPSLEGSNTCKTQCVSWLDLVLLEEYIDRLTEHGTHPVVPRYSGPMEELQFYTEGPLVPYKKSSGEIVYNRVTEQGGRVFWAIPPQKELVALSEDTSRRFKINETYCKEIRSKITTLLQIEAEIMNAEVPAKLSNYKEALIKKIKDTYKPFFNIGSKQEANKVDGWYEYALSFFIPLTREEQLIKQSKEFLNSLYMAIVDNWTIYHEYPLSQSSSEEFSQTNETSSESDLSSPDLLVPSPRYVEDSSQEEGQEEGSSDSDENPNQPESLVAYLPLEVQKKICSLIGRPYCGEARSLDKGMDMDMDMEEEGYESGQELRVSN